MITTVNLPVRLILNVINITKELACSGNIKMSRGDFIALCLMRKIKKLSTSSYEFERKAVKYQPAKVCVYKKVLIGFSWDEYDANLLCRFSRKFSVSLLTADAIREFAEDIKNELLSDCKILYNYISRPVEIIKLKLTKNNIADNKIAVYVTEIKKEQQNANIHSKNPRL